jgi:hypothetical protein
MAADRRTGMERADQPDVHRQNCQLEPFFGHCSL